MTTSTPKVFLDANILFSACYPGSTIASILALAEAGSVELVTSLACVAEARGNLMRKQPRRVRRLEGVLDHMTVRVFEGREHLAWALELIHQDDSHVLAAAAEAAVTHLVTGATSHFGALMDQDDLPFRVRTPRMFLEEGPPAQPPVAR